jgi:histidine decarboxylase
MKHTSMTEVHQELEEFLAYVKHHSNHVMGYPAARDYNYDALKPFLDYSLNNVGDPFVNSTNKDNSRHFEREVLAFWAELLRAPEDNWWGYVTNGGTEGNLYGLYLARELYPKGVVYYSQDTHYSVSKNLHFLNMRNIMIRSQKNGEIDYEDLRETLRVNRDVPPIIFANIGTTMTEAKDDITKIQGIMRDMAIPSYYIHSDAAMCGAMAPFMKNKPSFDFADGADSISISGHKFIGSPIPCGLVLARKSHVNRIARSVAYIGNLDTTVTGSRNGLTPLILWYAMKRLGKEGLTKRVNDSLALTEYTVKAMNDIGIPAWRNPDAITVVIPEVNPIIKEKWQLATANGISHIMLMPFVTKDHVDALIADMKIHPAEGKANETN